MPSLDKLMNNFIRVHDTLMKSYVKVNDSSQEAALLIAAAILVLGVEEPEAPSASTHESLTRKSG